MERSLDVVLTVLQHHREGMEFADLVTRVAAEAMVDEATAKTSILRLNFEGKLGIDADWVVHMEPELVATVAAA